MATVDTRMKAMTARLIAKSSGGAQVTFVRVTGLAPNVTETTATVTAIVRNYLPAGGPPSVDGYSATKRGGISEGERQILVMASYLAAAKFPLPLIKGDLALVADTGERLKITRVDMTKRAIAACIEAYGVTP